MSVNGESSLLVNSSDDSGSTQNITYKSILRTSNPSQDPAKKLQKNVSWSDMSSGGSLVEIKMVPYGKNHFNTLYFTH